jgi:hypothetical protein
VIDVRSMLALVIAVGFAAVLNLVGAFLSVRSPRRSQAGSSTGSRSRFR